MQPVSLRQSRGARLSFLGGRKKEQPPSAHMNGGQTISEEGSGESPTRAHDSRRLSFFRAPSHENQRPTGGSISMSGSNGAVANGPLPKSGTEGSDWVTDSGGGSRVSYDTNARSGNTPVDSFEKERESSGGAGTPRLGGVKKRLSLLKLGKRTGRSNGMMGALNEE